MKKIKTRIKRALAAFLREELLEYIGYNHRIPFMSTRERFNVENLPFETVVMECEIPISPNNEDDRFELERSIQSAKEAFTRRVIEHIHVDAQNLTSSKHFMRRSVRLVLRVQGKRN